MKEKLTKNFVLILAITGNLYSQSQIEDEIFSTVDLKLKYTDEKRFRVKNEGESDFKIIRKKITQEIEDKNTIRFYGDSLIGVSDNLRKEVSLDLMKVKEISFVDGKSWGKGALYGTLIGLTVGLVAGAIAIMIEESASKSDFPGQNHSNSDPDFKFEFGGPGLILIMTTLAGITAGPLIGLIVGGFIDSYKSYELKTKDLEKKKKEIKHLALKYKRNLH